VTLERGRRFVSAEGRYLKSDPARFRKPARVELRIHATGEAGRPSVEVRRRMTDLLKKVAAATPTPEEVRAIRLVEALEQAGTAAARRLLADLAGGAAAARLTREAQAALQRLPHESGEER
jgi:hypothetical protein